MFRPFLIYSLLDNYYSQRNKKPKFLICLFEKHWGTWYVFLWRTFEAETTKESIKTKTESGNCFCIRVV